MMIRTYTLDLNLSNKYFEAILQFIKSKILNDKIEVLFDYFRVQKSYIENKRMKHDIKTQFSQKILIVEVKIK